MSCTAIIVAAGKSERFGGDIPKVFVDVAGKPVLAWTISQFEKADCISEIVLVVAEEFLPLAAELVSNIDAHKVRRIVMGGSTRPDSVRLGLQSLARATEYVAIHDGARPLVAVEDITAAVEVGQRTGAAILASRCTDALKAVVDGVIVQTLPKETHYLAQTPQVFVYQTILRAHERETASAPAADDAILIERLGVPVTVVEPKFPNPKITFPHDIVMLDAMLSRGIHV